VRRTIARAAALPPAAEAEAARLLALADRATARLHGDRGDLLAAFSASGCRRMIEKARYERDPTDPARERRWQQLQEAIDRRKLPFRRSGLPMLALMTTPLPSLREAFARATNKGEFRLLLAVDRKLAPSEE
jgi:hypothetical protein